jgi:hypothetical protein
MHDVAVRVGAADWREWLLCLADTRGLRQLELPAAVLDPDPPDALRLLDHLGLAVLHVADAIPANLSRYASESGLAGDEAGVAALVRFAQARLRDRVRFASLDLGLDRLHDEGVEPGLRRRTRFLRALLSGLETSPVVLAVRVRLPRPFAGSHEWEWAGNLLHEVGAARVGLALDVVLSDVPDDFAVEALLRECAAPLAVVRLHFRWRWGESPPAAVWERWCRALRHHPGRLGVVFCPQAPPLATAAALLADIQGWAEALGGAYPQVRPAAGGPPGPPPPARNRG